MIEKTWKLTIHHLKLNKSESAILNEEFNRLQIRVNKHKSITKHLLWFGITLSPLHIFLFHWAFTFTQFSIGKYHAIRIENYDYFTQLLI